jgi:hypothetical protein
MFTVPVSGQVWRTACDSLRIRTQVRPVSGNEWESSFTTVAPARRSAAQKVAMTSSGARSRRSVHPPRSTEYSESGPCVFILREFRGGHGTKVFKIAQDPGLQMRIVRFNWILYNRRKFASDAASIKTIGACECCLNA